MKTDKTKKLQATIKGLRDDLEIARRLNCSLQERNTHLTHGVDVQGRKLDELRKYNVELTALFNEARDRASRLERQLFDSTIREGAIREEMVDIAKVALLLNEKAREFADTQLRLRDLLVEFALVKDVNAARAAVLAAEVAQTRVAEGIKLRPGSLERIREIATSSKQEG